MNRDTMRGLKQKPPLDRIRRLSILATMSTVHPADSQGMNKGVRIQGSKAFAILGLCFDPPTIPLQPRTIGVPIANAVPFGPQVDTIRWDFKVNPKSLFVIHFL